MPSRIDDRWLWLGAGIFIFVAAQGIRKAIKDCVGLTQVIPPKSNPPPKDEQPPESSISLETLQTLSQSPNPNISNAAISLIVSRYVGLPKAFEYIMADVKSHNVEARQRASNALKLLGQHTLPSSTDADLLYLISSHQDSFYEPYPGSEYRNVSRSDPPSLPLMNGDDDYSILIPSEQNPVGGWTNVPRERPQSEDVVETELRRRRREAMVLHEGAGSVREADIIRPTHR